MALFDATAHPKAGSNKDFEKIMLDVSTATGQKAEDIAAMATQYVSSGMKLTATP